MRRAGGVLLLVRLMGFAVVCYGAYFDRVAAALLGIGLMLLTVAYNE